MRNKLNHINDTQVSICMRAITMLEHSTKAYKKTVDKFEVSVDKLDKQDKIITLQSEVITNLEILASKQSQNIEQLIQHNQLLEQRLADLWRNVANLERVTSNYAYRHGLDQDTDIK